MKFNDKVPHVGICKFCGKKIKYDGLYGLMSDEEKKDYDLNKKPIKASVICDKC